MKVALVHDYLTEYGGAERVLEAIHEIWPRAPVYTSIVDENVVAELALPLERAKQASLLQNIPLISKLVKQTTFFMPLIFENLDLRGYDLVISDGTIWSKGVLTTPEQLHIFYCHTPPRWLYGYPGETDRRRLWYLQPLLKPLDNWLRIWDFETAQRPDYIIANSKTTAARIRKFWRREARVIYPPVSVRQCVSASVRQKTAAEENPTGLSVNPSGWARPPANSLAGEVGRGIGDGYFLVVSRLSAYKNVDLAIEACNQLNIPLVVVGTGREEERLKENLPAGRQVAGKNVKFLKHLKDSELSKVYKHCKVLLHPASDEDFGIAPVEAMAYGKPVIALRSGGVTETVIEGKTGIFFGEPTAESLTATIQQFNNLTFNPDDCVAQANKFSKKRFQKEFKKFVEEKWNARELDTRI